MKKDMIGRAVRLIVDVPLDFLGAVCDLLEKLSGKESGEAWFKELKKFILKKPCWTRAPGFISEFLKLISAGKTLTVDALDGKESLAEAADVFAYIDPKFENWEADERGEATEETVVDVYELVSDVTSARLFGSVCNSVSKLCFTKAQIQNFCVKYYDWLRRDNYSTFFLFKSHNYFFVARVYFEFNNRLGVNVYDLGFDAVWDTEYIRRSVVFPRLALK